MVSGKLSEVLVQQTLIYLPTRWLRTPALKTLTMCVSVRWVFLLLSGMLWTGAFVSWVQQITNGAVELWVLITRCKLPGFLYYFSQHYSLALLIIMSLEKFCALYFPLKTRSICTVGTAKWVTGIIAVIFVVYNSQTFFIFDVDPEYNICIMVKVPDVYKNVFFYKINTSLLLCTFGHNGCYQCGHYL